MSSPDLEHTWATLEKGLTQLLDCENAVIQQSSYMNLYTEVFNFCTHEQNVEEIFYRNKKIPNFQLRATLIKDAVGTQLYARLQNFISTYVSGLADKKLNDATNKDLKERYAMLWTYFKSRLPIMCFVFRHLNRKWIEQRINEGKPNVYTIRKLCITVWNKELSKVIDQIKLNVKSNRKGKFIDDRENNKFIVSHFEWNRLYRPNIRNIVNFDLNRGFKTFKHDSMYNGRIDPLIRYILEKATKSRKSLKQTIHGCKFVTNRGMLVNIGVFTTLDYFHDMEIYGTFYFQRFNGIIFACECPTKEQIEKYKNMSEFEKKKLFYWGNMFSQYMTFKEPGTTPNLDKPVSTLSSQYNVLKAEINDFMSRNLSFFINAELDAVDNDKFIEFKTLNGCYGYKPIPKHAEATWFAKERSKWYLQCILGDVNEIIVGIRNKSGYVKSVKQMNLDDVENAEKDNWNPQDCLLALSNFFNTVEAKLNTKPEGAILRVELRTKDKKFVPTWLNETESKKFEFLPKEFKQRFAPETSNILDIICSYIK